MIVFAGHTSIEKQDREAKPERSGLDSQGSAIDIDLDGNWIPIT